MHTSLIYLGYKYIIRRKIKLHATYLYPDVECATTRRDLFSIIGFSCLRSASKSK